MASDRRTVTPPLAFVVCVLVVAAVATTPAVAVQESQPAAAPQDSSAVEASLALQRSTRRLIQQGLRNAGFDLFRPRYARRLCSARGRAPQFAIGSGRGEPHRRGT